MHPHPHEVVGRINAFPIDRATGGWQDLNSLERVKMLSINCYKRAGSSVMGNKAGYIANKKSVAVGRGSNAGGFPGAVCGRYVILLQSCETSFTTRPYQPMHLAIYI